MECPACRKNSLASFFTMAGVVVEHCAECGGIWLDKGDILFLSKDSLRVQEAVARGLAEKKSTDRQCPRCEARMEEGSLFRPELQIDQCPKCLGLWFDDEELAQAVEEDPGSFRRRLGLAGGPAPLPDEKAAVGESPPGAPLSEMKLETAEVEIPEKAPAPVPAAESEVEAPGKLVPPDAIFADIEAETVPADTAPAGEEPATLAPGEREEDWQAFKARTRAAFGTDASSREAGRK
jgi:Zn-finger nucleic acid-binding protein